MSDGVLRLYFFYDSETLEFSFGVFIDPSCNLLLNC